MLVSALTVQSKHQEDEQMVTKFYKELDILEKSTDSMGKIDRENFGIYDYSKKNKLANNTEMEQENRKIIRQSIKEAIDYYRNTPKKSS